MSVASPDGGVSFNRLFSIIANGPLLGLFIVLGLEITGAALTIPIFSFFCIHELGLLATQVGALMSSFNLAQAFGGPAFGRASDAVGRRGILLLCFMWSSMCFAFTFFARGFWDLLCIRTLAGLSGGSIPVVAAVIMDCANPAERPRVLGFKGATIGLAVTTGPLISVALLAHDMTRRQIFLLAASLCFSGFLVGICILRESLSSDKRRPICGDGTSSAWFEGLADDWRGVRIPLVFAWMARFFYAFSIFCMYATYSFLVKDLFGWSDKDFGLILGFSGVGQGIVELFIYPYANTRMGEHWVCVIGFVFMVASLLTLPISAVSAHICALILFNLGQAFLEPGIVNLSGHHSPSEKHMGFTMGISNGFRAAAAVLAPFTAGSLYDREPWWAYMLASCAAIMGAVFSALCMVASQNRTLGEQTSLLCGDQKSS